MNNRFFVLLFCFFVYFILPVHAQMLLGKFDCNADQNGSLYGNNYLDSQINLSDLQSVGSNVTLDYSETYLNFNNSGLVGPANALYFSISPKEGYIAEIRKITMRIKKGTKSGNVILYYNSDGQPFTNSNSTSIYNAGNSNTDTVFSIINITYPANFTSPIKITDPTKPTNFILSSGSNGGALSVDYITVYGYVYRESDPPPADGVEKNFSVNLQESTGKVNPLLWGTNFLFWLEDDQALEDGTIEQSLKNLPVSVLRYPGGTVADNFHWKTNLLSNNNRFPYEEGDAESDFDEFMAFCQRVNAEPILVVNTESWQIAQDLDGGAQEAADWVQYCKDKGYKVKYWEIGNETYWHPFFTAREYGQAVKKYAQAMKAVDPTIKISANGHWDVQMVGTKERTNSARWETIRQMYASISTRQDTEAADAYADSFKDEDIKNGTEKWWNNVADECGEYIDMISIHWYYGGNTSMGSMTTNLNEVRELFKSKYPNREYTMCMTEYNCNNDDHKLAISGFFDGVARFLMAGVEIATQWPLRNGSNGGRTSLMYPSTKQEQYTYQILQMYAQNLKGDILQVTSDNQIFPFVTYDQKQLTVVVSGRAITSQPVIATMSLPEMEQFTLLNAKSFDAPATSNIPIRLVENDLDVTVSETGCTFKVLPYQTVMLRFKNDDYTTVRPLTGNEGIQYYEESNKIVVESAEKIHVAVYNLQGILMIEKSGDKKLEFEMDKGGVYLLRIVSGNNVYAGKVLVNNIP
jgi:hypothetical protein